MRHYLEAEGLVAIFLPESGEILRRVTFAGVIIFGQFLSDIGNSFVRSGSWRGTVIDGGAIALCSILNSNTEQIPPVKQHRVINFCARHLGQAALEVGRVFCAFGQQNSLYRPRLNSTDTRLHSERER